MIQVVVHSPPFIKAQAQDLESTTVTGTVAAVDIPALTMDVTATDDWSHTVGKTVEGEPGTGLKADTRYRARAQWRSTTDVDSPFSDTNTFKTAAGNPDPTPVGETGGLRFDSQRSTTLNRTASACQEI